MRESSGKSRFPWHALIIATLTIALLWGFIRGSKLTDVWFYIKSADLKWVAASVAITLVGYALRAWRWQTLLRPLGDVRFRNAFRTTLIGFAATNLLPLRPGEVLRPYLLARLEKLQFSSALATIIIERAVLDMASILLLFGVFLITTDIEVGSALKIAGAIGMACAIGALAVLIVCAGHPERLGKWAGRLAAALPGRAGEAVTRFVHTLADGLAVVRRPGPLVSAFGLSILLWVSIAIGIWAASRALDLTVSPVDSFLVVGYLAVGVSIPTPGGVGGFDWAYKEATTRFFGIDQNQATAAAMVLHAVSFLPVTILGLYFMWQDRLTVKSIRRVQASVEKNPEDPR